MIIEKDGKIEEYISLYNAIHKHTKDINMTTAILTEIRKDMRAAEMQQNRFVGTGAFPATEGQISYLKWLGIETTDGITRQEASKLIDEAKTKKADTENPVRIPMRLP